MLPADIIGGMDRDLSRGANGRSVTLLQQALDAVGYDIAVDGKFGPLTEAIVDAYQLREGIPRTGTANAVTRRALNVDVLARTLWGEARGEPAGGLEAVAAVVMNRVAKGVYGLGVAGVCLQPWQFSCWNRNDPNRPRMRALHVAIFPRDNRFRLAAAAAVDGRLEDPTSGALHYHANYVQPAWARGKAPCYRLGVHLFFNDID